MSGKKKIKFDVKKLLIALLPTLVIFLIALAFMVIKLPTHVELKVVVDELMFTAAGDNARDLINTKIAYVTLSDFNKLELNPVRLDMLDFDDNLQALDFTPPVTIRGIDESLRPSVRIGNVRKLSDDVKEIIPVYSLSIDPGAEVSLKYKKNKIYADVKVDEDRDIFVTGELIIPQEHSFELSSSNALIDGITGGIDEQDVTLVMNLEEYSPNISVRGKNNKLSSVIKLLKGEKSGIFSDTALPISAISFFRLTSSKEWQTTLLAPSELTYPDFPYIDTIKIKETDFLRLEKLKKFTIKSMILDEGKQGIELLLDGIAGGIKAGTGDFNKDYRLSIFRLIWKNPFITLLIAILTWGFSTSVGLIKFVKGFIKTDDQE